ncbi:MAG: hypothetical protein Q4E24_09965 [bacterium]|nr:hypothetical protein [bacterium]
MDKYEFNLKVEQMKKMVKKGDYSTAMKIADGIDWRRVRNAALLSTVAQIYENNNQYQEAKEILLLALERAPIGKRLLFKLTELELKENNISEAESYYQEYCDLAQDDSGQYLLRYEILKEKGAPLEQLIHALENYTREELDEKWMYELAELYSEADMVDDCIATCDRIMLMFGLGKYVDKAMDLKIRYAPLTKYQMDLVENRDKYEEQLRAVEQEYSMPENRRRRIHEEQIADAGSKDMDESDEFSSSRRPRLRERQEKVSMKEYAVSNGDLDDEGWDDSRGKRPVVRVMERAPETEKPYTESEPEEVGYNRTDYGNDYNGTEYEEAAYEKSRDGENGYGESAYEQSRDEITGYEEPEREENQENRYKDAEYEDEQIEGQAVRSEHAPVIRRVQRTEDEEQELRIHMHEEEVEKHLAEEMSKMSVDNQKEDLGATRIMPVIRRSSDYAREDYTSVRPAAPASKKEEVVLDDDIVDDVDDIEEIDMEEQDETVYNHLMIEAENVEDGVRLAVKALKKLQEETGEKRSAAKLSAEKLNQKGLQYYLPKLAGKNLIINDAARMNLDAQNELMEFLKSDNSGMVVVLMDTPLHLEILHSHNPQLAKYFSYIGVEANPEDAYEENVYEAPVREKREPVKENTAASASYEKKPARNTMEEEPEYEERPSRRAERSEDSYGRDSYDKNSYDREPAEKESGRKMLRKEKAVQSMVQEPMNETREKRPEQVRVKTQEDNVSENGVMSINDFAKYACEYAKSIDCSIVGKSLLALYERAELMDADGIPLIRENAEDLIEEAADKAEKKSLGRLIAGIFSPRYDKEGKLILKESHFLN